MANSTLPERESPGGSTFGAWWMVAVLLLFSILSMLDRQILTMLVPPIKKDLGLTDFEISLIIGPAFAVSSALAALPIGWAADRFPRRWVIFVGIASWSACCAASSLTRTFGGLFAARAGVAIGEASLGPTVNSLIADRFPRRRLTLALAVHGLAPKLGIACAFALGGAAMAFSARAGSMTFPIIGELGSWRLVLFLVGAPGLLLSLLTFSFSEPTDYLRKRDRSQDATVVSFSKANWQMLLLLLLGFSSMGICSGAINNWAPTFLTRQFGWTPIQYGAPMSLISLIGALAIIPKGMIVDWLYGRGVHDAHVRFFTWLQLTGLPLIIIAFLMTQVVPFMIFYGLINILTLSYTLYIGSTLQIITPKPIRGRLVASFGVVVGLVTQGLAPTLVASVTDFVFHDENKIGYSLIIVAGSALIISCILLNVCLARLGPYLSAEHAGETPAAPLAAQGSTL